MMEWVQTLPIVGGVAFLYLLILLRAGGTYALGRGARKAANRGKVAAWLESERVERASRIINKWGAPVVAFSFLTVGFQTAANAAAGLTGMSLKRYLPALAVGGFAWAVDRKSTRLNSSHVAISYAVFCLKKKKDEKI